MLDPGFDKPPPALRLLGSLSFSTTDRHVQQDGVFSTESFLEAEVRDVPNVMTRLKLLELFKYLFRGGEHLLGSP